MSQILEDQLSAFLDGELPEEQLEMLLVRLERDPGYRATFARYSLIGECLRGQASPAAIGLTDRVRASLDAAGTTAPAVGATVRSGRAWQGWAAAALAASAAAVAIVMLNLPGAGGESATLVKAPVVPVSPAPQRMVSSPPLAPARMTNYLVYHLEYANPALSKTLDSHLIAGQPRRVSWQEPEGRGNGR